MILYVIVEKALWVDFPRLSSSRSDKNVILPSSSNNWNSSDKRDPPLLLFLRLFSYTRPATVGAEGRIGSQTLVRPSRNSPFDGVGSGN